MIKFAFAKRKSQTIKSLFFLIMCPPLSLCSNNTQKAVQFQLPFSQLWKTKKITTPSSTETYSTYANSAYLCSGKSFSKAKNSVEKLLSLKPKKFAYDVIVKFFNKEDCSKKITDLPIFTKFDKELGWDTLAAAACALEETGQTKKSETFFKNLLELYPEKEQIAHYNALRLLKRGDPGSALIAVDDFLNRTNSRRTRNLSFFHIKANILAQAPFFDYKQALLVLDQAMEINPYNEKILKLKFLLHEKTGDLAGGTQTLLQLASLSEDPRLKESLIARFFNNQEYEKALSLVHEMDQRSTETLFNKAFLYYKLKQNDKAMEYASQCLQKSHLNRKAIFLKAELLLDQYKSDECVNLLLRWVRIAPRDIEALNFLALAGKKGCDNETVAKELISIFTKNQKNLDILAAAAHFCLEGKFYDKALKAFELLTQKGSFSSGVNTKICCGKAKALGGLGRIDEAESFLNLLAQESQPNANVCVALAELYLYPAKLNFSLADKHIEQALARSPFNSRFHSIKSSLLSLQNPKQKQTTIAQGLGICPYIFSDKKNKTTQKCFFPKTLIATS